MSKKITSLKDEVSDKEKFDLVKQLIVAGDSNRDTESKTQNDSLKEKPVILLLIAVLPLFMVLSLIKIKNHLVEFEELKSEKNRAYGLYNDLILLADKSMLNSARIADMTDDLVSSSKQTKIDEVSYVVYEDSSKKNKADKTAMWLEFASNIFSGVASAATSVMGGGGLGSSSGLSGLTGLLSSNTAATSTSTAIAKK